MNSSTGSVAVIVAHPDDEVLGCGGTMARLAREGRDVHVLILSDGETSRVADPRLLDAERLAERHTAAHHAAKILRSSSVAQLSLPDNKLDTIALLDIVKAIESFVTRYQPVSVFTHHSGDVNIDHRIVHDAVIAACRPQPGHCVRELLFFEVPSSTEWRPPGSAALFAPNWFVDISMTFKDKLNALEAYREELRDFPHPRSVEAVEALARWRGATVGVSAAEAFVLGRKLV